MIHLRMSHKSPSSKSLNHLSQNLSLLVAFSSILVSLHLFQPRQRSLKNLKIQTDLGRPRSRLKQRFKLELQRKKKREKRNLRLKEKKEKTESE